MAHIVEFKITGLAGRKDVIHEKLHRNVNVFFGLNGSGKTSLLKILDSAMSGNAQNLISVPFNSAEVVIYSLTENRNLTRKIHRKDLMKSLHFQEKLVKNEKIRYIDANDDVKYSQYNEEKLGWDTSNPDKRTTGYEHIFLPVHRIIPRDDLYFSTPNYRSTQYVGKPMFDWDQYFADNLEHLWMKYSNISLSEVQKIQQLGLAKILTSVLSTEPKIKLRESKTELKNDLIYNRMMAFLGRQGLPQVIKDKKHFQQRYQTDFVFKQVVTDIEDIERNIESAVTARNKLQQLINDMFSGNKSLIFSDTGIEVKTKDRHRIGLHSLSSGEKQAIFIFIETLLINQSALMIDEPEISMHVDWQRKLLSSMQLLNPNAQLIFATHSPEIMADVPDENIFKL
jgi:predicted ATPase